MFSYGDKVQAYEGGPVLVIRKVTTDGKFWARPARQTSYNSHLCTTYAADELIPYTPADKHAPKKGAEPCQLCGRHIHCSKGKIAHHGYTRPGFGGQTASCYGARFPSYLVSRDRLGQYINEAVPNAIARLEMWIERLRTESPEVRGPAAYDRMTGKKSFPHIGSTHPRYAEFNATAQENAARDIREWRASGVGAQERYDAWKAPK